MNLERFEIESRLLSAELEGRRRAVLDQLVFTIWSSAKLMSDLADLARDKPDYDVGLMLRSQAERCREVLLALKNDAYVSDHMLEPPCGTPEQSLP